MTRDYIIPALVAVAVFLVKGRPMAIEYAISAGEGTLIDYGAVQVASDIADVWYEAEDTHWVGPVRPDLLLVMAYTPDAYDCETGR